MGKGSITSLGLGSSLDLQGILDSRRKADEAMLNYKKTTIKSRMETKAELNRTLNRLLAMKTSALSLSLGSNYRYRSVGLSDKTVATASVLDNTQTGLHRVRVSRLASRSSYKSDGFSATASPLYTPWVQESTKGFKNADIVLAEGKSVKIKYGPENGQKVITITAPKGGLTADTLVGAIQTDPANQDGKGNRLVSAATYTDGQGKKRIRISAATGENRVAVEGPGNGIGFAAPVKEFSLTLGKKKYAVSVPAGTTLEGLAKRINRDEANPGIIARVINTGSGDNPFQLVIEAKQSGEDARITITGEPPGLSLSEKNGSGYTIKGENSISFATPLTIDASANTILFQEDSGTGYSEKLSARIPEGTYKTGEDLAKAIEQALEQASLEKGNAKDYQVGFNKDTGKMEICEAGTLKGLKLNWDEGGSTVAGLLGFSKAAEITPASASLNSSVTIDGTTFQRQDNTGQTDLIQGVTLSLNAIGTTTLSVESRTDNLKEKIISLIDTFNELITEIDKNDDFDKEKNTWGTLARSSAAKSLKVTFKTVFSTKAGAGSEIKSFMDLGLKFNRDGTIDLDKQKLAQHLKKNFSEVEALFLGSKSQKGLADTLNQMIGDYALSDGSLKSEITAIDNQTNRMEKSHKEALARLDEKYDALTKEFVALDKYLAQLSSTTAYLKKMLPKEKED